MSVCGCVYVWLSEDMRFISGVLSIESISGVLSVIVGNIRRLGGS